MNQNKKQKKKKMKSGMKEEKIARENLGIFVRFSLHRTGRNGNARVLWKVQNKVQINYKFKDGKRNIKT